MTTTPQAFPATFEDSFGDERTIDAHVHTGTQDAWGNVSPAHKCQLTRPGAGRTTYFLCNHEAVALLVNREGDARPACAKHVGAAKRRRTTGYYSDPIAILSLDGEQTHTWVTTSPARGYFTPVT